MSSTNYYQEKKRKILSLLAVPDQSYTDLSPKGSVDEGVRQLCDEINALEEYVTTSSCAGRVAVFLDGSGKLAPSESADDERVGSAGGKGGGKWLYVSHDPMNPFPSEEEGSVWSLFGIDANTPISFPLPDERVRYVHLRFEPMILHILTSSLSAATHAHTSAFAAGFRESGISSISSSNPTPLVAIRTQGLALSSIIAYNDPVSNVIHPMVSEAYLRTLLHVANQRFVANSERKERFRRALLRLNEKPDQDWEPADLRRERKRAEGLRQKEELMKRENGDHDRHDDDEIDYSVGIPDDDALLLK